MSKPRAEIAAFLSDTNWSNAKLAPLAGDASLRRYWRLIKGTQTAVLMDAPPVTGETTEPFIQIAQYLENFGYSTPRLYKTDTEAGLILMEDLGDALFIREVVRAPRTEIMLYEAAIDLLADLAQRPAPHNSPVYDSQAMIERASLASRWYAGSRDSSEVSDALQAALASLSTFPTTFALRDFHAENLLWLPNRNNLARIGLLDFQDATRAPIGYDLISLLYDARRDVPPELIPPLRQRFAKAVNLPTDDLEWACAVLGAQRSLRILGIFARLSLHFGKYSYVDLIPRVWAQLEACLSHPVLSDLARACRASLPPPSADHLNDLRARCGTIPTL